MTRIHVGIPESGEYPPYASIYVSLVSESDVLSALEAQVEETIDVVSQVDPERARSFRYAAGKWTLNEVLGHMADTERIFAYRALRIGRGDTTPLPGFEQDDFVANGPFGDRNLPELIEDFRIVRLATLSLAGAFQTEAWTRMGTTSGFPTSTRGLLYLALGHERYHLRIIRERYL